jgi:small subunit ribosomal protein S20
MAEKSRKIVGQKLFFLTFALRKIFYMANHSATKKDVRQAAKRNERNRYYGKTTRNAISKLKDISSKPEALDSLKDVSSMIDKLAKRGVIHKNKAANLKSKLTKKINAKA